MEREEASQVKIAHDTRALEGTPPSRDDAARVSALCGFARSIGISEETALAVYRQEVQRLTAGAKFTRFVPLLAEKCVKDVLRGRARR